MKQAVAHIELPVFTLQLKPSECRFDSVDEIADYFRQQIESHKAAKYIATFNHLEHTASLPEGQIAADMDAAVNLIFCFGFTLQDPSQLAMRPRSMGISHDSSGFTISFIEAPMPVINALMEEWAYALKVDSQTSQDAAISNI